MTSPEHKPRLWVLPSGLYPRRVTIYLEEKGIADKFDIIPVRMTPGGLEQVEGKPPGTVPILEISRPTQESPGRYIFQSTAILEYLEDVYGTEGPDMRGSTTQVRARVRECMDVVNEATTYLVLFLKNSSSHIAKEQTARESPNCMQVALNLLETLADPEGPFLTGERPMIVDCMLVASVQFVRGLYGVDITAGHERLKVAVEAFESSGTAVFPEIGGMGIGLTVPQLASGDIGLEATECSPERLGCTPS